MAGGRLLHSPCRCERDPDSRGEKLKQLTKVPEERAAAERRAYDAAIAEHPEWVVNALRWPAEEATETSRLTTSAECPSGAQWKAAGLPLMTSLIVCRASPLAPWRTGHVR